MKEGMKAGMDSAVHGRLNSAGRLDGAAGVGEGTVVLTDVDAIGIQGGGEAGVVVEYKWHTRGAADRKEASGDALDRRQVVVFRTELEAVTFSADSSGT
jgi:hypothetical protein